MKLNILQTVCEYFGYVGISPSPKKFRFNAQHILTLILFLQFAIALIVFFVFTATGLNDYVDCFYGLASALANLVIYSSNVSMTPRIFKLIADIEIIIEKRCENPSARAMYERANDNANKLTRYIYVALVNFSTGIVFYIHLFGSFFIFFTTDLGEESFRLPFPIEYPFNWKTPIGYTIAFVVTFAAFHIMGQSGTCVLGLLIGLSNMITSLLQDFKEDLNFLNRDKRRLCDFVKLHSQTLQFVSEFTNIYRLVIPGYFMWSVLTICDNLLSFQFEMTRNSQSPVTWISILRVIWSFIHILFVCYYGEQLTTGFYGLKRSIYECDWYILPLEAQKMLPIIGINTQEPVYLEGFANTRCTLETWKGIVDGGFSYFMLLRQVAH